MENSNIIIAEEKIFAAANGYSGFRSLFDKIFDSRDHLRVYIIKGGPGTGKSTLMKKVLNFGNANGYRTRAIFCSSDIASLDGVVLRSARGSIAILDGTAPHARDAVIPGAIDEIINLGDSFNKSKLSESRSDIIRLTSVKKEAYSSAYSYLSLCGHITALIRDIFQKIIDYSYAESVLDNYLSKTNTIKSLKIERFYCTAFAKDGRQRISHRANNSLQRIVVGADEDLAYMFMNFLCDKLTSQGLVRLICPSALIDSDIDLFETGDALFTKSESEEYDIDARRLLATPAIPESVIKLREIRSEITDMAIERFTAASKAHFELEKIYSQCVRFDEQNKVFENLTAEIKGLLG